MHITIKPPLETLYPRVTLQDGRALLCAHALLFSDIHLGSPDSHPEPFRQIMKKLWLQKHVVVGDLFNDPRTAKLRRDEWKFLRTLGEREEFAILNYPEVRDALQSAAGINASSPAEDGVDIITPGNHDYRSIYVAEHYLGHQVEMVHVWEHAGVRYLATHGHQYDSFCVNNQRTCHFASWIFPYLQRLDGPRRRVTRYLESQSGKWNHSVERIRTGITKLAVHHGAAVAFVGHTHIAEDTTVHGVRVVNVGSIKPVTDGSATFAIIDLQGKIHIHRYTVEDQA